MVSYKPVGSGFILWQRFSCSTDSFNVLENKDNLTFTSFIVDVKGFKSTQVLNLLHYKTRQHNYVLPIFVSEEDVTSYYR